ncbi:MAG: hypothetical protein A2W19_11825 [Spirochaetes bacterium RBG_16_49_21]|nr:MAG: hypothetical protein A2W19_11825 [Spirochaetes bacterium RBG_16_49_21]
MKCKQVKILLADYLDNQLSAKDRALVKEHCKHCSNCGEELVFLKTYKKEIASFPMVQAPADFLARLRKRIEKPAVGRTLIRVLFYPLRIKLPLEAAGVCALALIMVLIFNPFKPETFEYKSREPFSDVAQMHDKYADSRGVTEHRSGTNMPPMAAKEPRTKLKDGSIRSPEGKVAAEDADMLSGRKKAATKERDRKADDTPAQTGAITLYLARNAAPESETQSRESMADDEQAGQVASKEYDKAAQPMREEMKGRGEKAYIHGHEPAVTIIEDITYSLEGRIVRKVYDEKTKFYRLIIIELPRKNYTAFIETLAKTWTIRKQEPEKLPEKPERMRVMLNIGP